ncbi:hypothetical protein K474DRAFT_1106932 [Panus rudis PR-1116 ss-1]|nr:hypothetical protein K474DRAFT_1106932 [Panus rudis PR-1116 ss-1]
MADPAPSQPLPSWLTLSSALITDENGGVSTSFATLTLPLTYYGPSIPLGTDGRWTYGGLTPPPSTTAEPTITSPPISSATPSPTITPSPTTSTLESTTASSSPSPSSELSSALSTSSSPSSSTTAAAAASHGISAPILGAILGSILGAVLLVLLGLIICLLCRHQRRRRPSDDSGQSSSFWNRSTTLFTRPGSRTDRHRQRQTPIWTGWEMVDPDEYLNRTSGSDRGDGEGRRTPGEGSPRGSGDEIDPFLTRRSIHSGTAADQMSQIKTGTDTLVSVPVAAATGNTAARSSPPATGRHIVPPEELNRMMAEYENTTPPEANIRIVEASPHVGEHSPLLPPPPLDPDGLGGLNALGLRPSRNDSDRSVGSAASPSRHRSIISQVSQKSAASEYDPDSAELLTARRVHLGTPGTPRTLSTLPLHQDPEAGPSQAVRNMLGLGGLGGRLGRLSWFKRMSGSGSPPSSYPGGESTLADPYTRTPPRSHSRHSSRSQRGSWSRLPQNEPDADQSSPSPTSRHSHRDSGIGLGLGLGLATAGAGGSAARLTPTASSRPISSVSAKSAASGNTVYHDAVSTPVSDSIEFPPPVASSSGATANAGPSSNAPSAPSPLQQSFSQGSSDTARFAGLETIRAVNPPSERPPSYGHDEDSFPRLSSSFAPPSGAEIDILDIPAPSPVSPFTSSRPAFPPGLVPLPTPRAWRDSYSSVGTPISAGSSGEAGIGIDILEEEPPAARAGWRSLASGIGGGGGGGSSGSAATRRTTFGNQPVIIQNQPSKSSEEASLHSMRSHLSPYASRSPVGSAPASRHTLTGSGSSRPSAHSHNRSGTGTSGSLAHSVSVSSFERRPRRRADLGEVSSPPLSAVYHRQSHTQSSPPSPLSPRFPPAIIPDLSATASPSSSSKPLLSGDGERGGTVGSSSTARTEATGTNSSVTTALTDPITGAVMHFPSLPWRSAMDGDHDRAWSDSNFNADAW